MRGPNLPRRSASTGFAVAVTCATLVMGTACNTNARAQPIPTVPPQPTLNKTMDAVVRGLLPTATRPTSTRSTLQATRAAIPPPEPRAPTATEVAARPAAATTRDLAESPVGAASTPRLLPTETRGLVVPPSLTAPPPTTASPIVPARPAQPAALGDEPVGAVRAPPTPTASGGR